MLWNHTNGQTNFTNFSISKLTTDDGLSQGSNYFRFEDSQGFMWITGNDALNRFDGKTVKVYNLDKYFDGCPNLQQGYGFTEDNLGNLYVGSVSGLYIYNRNRDKFTLQKIFKNKSDDIAMPIAFKDGKIWCFNKEFQLSTYDVKTKKVSFVTKLDLKPLASVHIYELSGNVFYYHYPTMDNEGNLWFIGNNDILKYKPKTASCEKPLQDYILKNKPTFYASFYDKFTNTLLLGTYNSFIEFNIASNKTTTIKQIDGKPIKLVTGITSNKDVIIIKSEIIGNLLLNKNTQEKIILGGYDETRSYNCPAFDKSNRLWFCQDAKGQVIYDFMPWLINKVTAETYPREYKNKNGVGSFSELPDNTIILQPNFIFNSEKQKLTKFQNINLDLGYKTTTDTFNNGVWIFCLNTLVSTPTKEIYFLDQEKKITTVISEKTAISDEPKDIQILSKDALLCSFTSGLYWLNVKQKKLEKVENNTLTNPFKINILSNNYVAVSYINKGMVLYKLLPNKQLQIVKTILPKIQSFYIQEDRVRNKYWVGTNQGIYLLDKNFKTVQKFDANNGLAGTYIYGLLLDNEGNVFCSHQQGLSSINTSTLQVTNYDKKDGIQDLDFNNRAFYKAKDGTLYFGGRNGFNYFKPPLIPKSYYKPEVYVDEILINNKSINFNKASEGIQKIELNYQQNNIVVKAFVKDLVNATSLEIIYRIKEIDAQWKHLTNGTPINFSNLAPSNYTLQLGYFDKYANKEIYQKTLIIKIGFPIYKKVWFWIMIMGYVLVAALYIVYKRRLAKQKTIFQQQLALEQQRNKITADLHDDIGAILSSLQINSAVANRLMTKNPQEAQLVLEKIENQSQNLADKIGDIIWSMKPGKDEFMSMSSRIKNFANDILGSTNINYKIEIDLQADKKITDITTRKNIVLIIKEAINNVAKYSKATQLGVVLEIEKSNLKIAITDNGIGFDASIIKGNGILNMQKRVAELKGSFNIISNENSGTTILVSIPCN